MKKKLLICLINLIIGGTEKALINLLNRIDSNQFEVDLLLGEKRGEFLESIPKHVNVIDSRSIGFIRGGRKTAVLYNIKKGKYLSAVKVVGSWLKNEPYSEFYSFDKVDKLVYDIAISFSVYTVSLLRLINNYAEAPVKVAFLHEPPIIGQEKVGTVEISERIMFMDNYTHICGVSETVTQEFRSLCPQFADKCTTVYNFIDEGNIKIRANESIDEMNGREVKILSVGRFTAQKNFTVIPSVCEELTKRKIDFKWYIVGDGDEKDVVQKVIDKNGLNDRLILLGAKINPYPYFKACDIYCQPSLSEAYCITVAEARILGKPIVATEFPGIREQLSDGQGGIIADNNAVALADGIEKVVRMSEEEREEMLAIAAYPNALERAAQNRLFEIIGQK